MAPKRNITITPALPYANGTIHIGHLTEHVLADIWARYYKLRGHDCRLICASDTHGAPIMLNAKSLGISPEELVETSRKGQIADLGSFEISYDHYSSTNSPTNKALADKIFLRLEENGHISKKVMKQAYCENDQMFLPDRFVKGTCPKCKSPDQYGDGCEVCSAVYDSGALINASCALCGTAPVTKESEHLFLDLNNFKTFLKEWLPQHTDSAITNKMGEWLEKDLQSWCISRDKPYFGFEIPGHPGKYYYVWFDAPVGYMAALQEYCAIHEIDFEQLWNRPDHEIFHVIGKDIIYHHSLFWPAMLEGSAYRTPTKVLVHGMLNINGKKMSKSRGTFILARTYAKHLEPSYLRYYIACKLNGGIDDLELNFDDFVSRVNSDLIGKITNVASRGAQMLHKLDGKIVALDSEGLELVKKAQNRASRIAELYEQADFSKAMIEIRDIADDANKYFDQYEPWKLIKTDAEQTKIVLATILNLFRVMAIYLKPVLPSYAAKVEKLFLSAPFTWDDAMTVVEGQELGAFSHLLKRVDPKKITTILDETKADFEKSQAAKLAAGDNTVRSDKQIEAIAPEIDYDTFMKIDLRVAKIVGAENVPKANKLLKLTLDLGGETRQVFAGIKAAYDPEKLIGRHTVMVANLAPRKMKFGLSEGMVLAAGDGAEIYILSPDSGAKPGQRIS